MKNLNFINIIKNECRFLENDGYQLNIIDRNIWYEKQTDNNGLRISFGWTEYDCLWISGLTANKRFNEVERIIDKTINIDLKDLYTIHVSPNPKDIPEGLKYVKSSENINFEIYSHEELLLFIDFLKSFYYNTVMPFFEEYESLTKIISWLDKKDISEHLNLIVSNGNTLMIRKLILMKLSNDTKFQDLYLRYNKYLVQKNIERESPYVDMYYMFKKLTPFFEK